MNHSLLVINGGSSSIKFAVFSTEGGLKLNLSGQVKGIGSENMTIETIDEKTNQNYTQNLSSNTFEVAIQSLADWLKKQNGLESLAAIGHRLVFGMEHTQPQEITPHLLKELKEVRAYDPDHMPSELKLVEACQNQFPGIKQIACFDTAFHASMPELARRIAIPKKFTKNGIHRYGFHGLSCSYLIGQLPSGLKNKKVIIAHLGNGASMTAVREGKSIETSMGFTPAAGLVMSTRTGDMDPGVAWYLMKMEKLTPSEFNYLINHESGLLAISETSSDIQELLKKQSHDSRARQAIVMFCYQAKKWIGSLTAVLGGLDVLVFSGGIGEHSAEIRAAICQDLSFLGIGIDPSKNKKNERIISTPKATVSVQVIKTNEELMIAKHMHDILKN